jgi:hypothetical protein
MVSIAESMRGLNGDGWGTTLSKEEQLAHQEYASKLYGGGRGLNSAYEDSREREMAKLRGDFGLKSDFNRDSELTKMKTGFIDGFLPKEKSTVDADLIKQLIQQINEIKSKHDKDIIDLLVKLDDNFKTINGLSKRIETLESQVKELSKPGFFKRMYNKLFSSN